MKEIHRQTLQFIQNDLWDSAHQLIQDYSDPLSCRIHGYLHRIEGDIASGRYWYQRAGLDIPNNTLDNELKELLSKLSE